MLTTWMLSMATATAWSASGSPAWMPSGRATASPSGKGGRQANLYTSAYAILALAEAKAAGVSTPGSLTEEAVDWLERAARNPSQFKPEYYSDAVWADTRALMLYALARHGRVLAAEINELGGRRRPVQRGRRDAAADGPAGCVAQPTQNTADGAPDEPDARRGHLSVPRHA